MAVRAATTKARRRAATDSPTGHQKEKQMRKHLLFFLHRHAKSGESKKAVVQNSLNDCFARDDGRASSYLGVALPPTDSRSDHHFVKV
jgi:hypothetical protein